MGPNHFNTLQVTSSYRVGQRPGNTRSAKIPLNQLSFYIHSFRCGTNCSIHISKSTAVEAENSPETTRESDGPASAEKPATRRRRR
jgi:hypothetical protein